MARKLAVLVRNLHLCSINIALKIELKMKKEQNLTKMVFRDHYNNLSDKGKEEVRNLILAESGMSYTTFYYKLRYNTFKPLELKLIDNVLKAKKRSHDNV